MLPPKAVVFDLDGVVRLYDPHQIAAIEDRYGVPRGAIHDAAFEPELLARVTTGQIADDGWRSAIATELSRDFEQAAQAVSDWTTQTGAISTDALAIVRACRARQPVALLTNATTRLPIDLERLGLHDQFDAIFNSSAIGLAKPDPKIYTYVAAQLQTDPADLLFIDDRKSNVDAATSLGWRGHQFESATKLRDWLVAEGALTVDTG
jgi:putative hydrolase of the HAD superfamily